MRLTGEVVTQTPYQKPDLYVDCPTCSKKSFGVGHLAVGQGTAWYCDVCGMRFRIERLKSGDFKLEPSLDRKEIRIVTLQSNGPVQIMVEGMRLIEGRTETEEEHIDHQRYYYDEHTCPTNYLGVLKVIDPTDGDGDPHGIFVYQSEQAVQTVDVFPEACPCGYALTEEDYTSGGVELRSCGRCEGPWFMLSTANDKDRSRERTPEAK